MPVSLSARDILLLGVDACQVHLHAALAGITLQEYHWEPIPSAERSLDLDLPPQRKKVWRVYRQAGKWLYDYTLEALDPSPFTTIAWIVNHVAQTADMYLYCVMTGQPEGVDRTWDDLPVYGDFSLAKDYLFRSLEAVRGYLSAIPSARVSVELAKMTPAPWGELRPAHVNIWGGVIEHALQHAAQIAARKDRIRYGY
jgi:hypothetical protein